MGAKKNKKIKKHGEKLLHDKGHNFVEKPIGEETAKIAETPKKRRSSKEIKEKIESGLTAIYADSEGKIPDMQSFAKRKGASLATALSILMVSCIFLAAAVWFSFSAFGGKKGFVEKDVVLSISGDEEIAMGKDVTYRVRFRNAQNVELNKATLELRYPEGFEFVTSSRAALGEKQDRWDIGSLKRDESGFIDITGRVYAPLGSELSFRTFLHYQPANFSSVFQRAAQVTSKITKSPVDVSVSGPTEVRAGKEATYKVLVKTDIKDVVLPGDLRLQIKDGSNFSVANSDPAQKNGASGINSEKQEQEFTITGSFAINEDTTGTSMLGFVVVGKKAEQEFTLFEISQPVTLLATDIKATLVVNGKTEPFTLTPGELVNTSIIVENLSQEALTEVQIQLSLEAPAYNKKSIVLWQKLDDVFEGDVVGDQISDTMRRGTVSWNKKHIPDLASLKPGAKVVIDLRVPLQNSDETDLSVYEAFKGFVTLDVKYKKEDVLELVSASSLEFNINSDAKIDVRSEKNEGLYKISWVLTNSFHDLENVKIEADLFGDISFDANAVSAPAGSISYDDVSKRLTWTIKNMPTSVDTLALQFDVKLNKINPSQKNISSRVRGKATDLRTGKEVELVGDEVLAE